MGWRDAPLINEEEQAVASWRDAPIVSEAKESWRDAPIVPEALGPSATEINQATAAEKERVLGIARGALGQAPFPTIRGGVLAGGARLLSGVARVTGQDGRADFWSHYSNALVQVVGERAEEPGRITPPIVKRGLAGALASGPIMAASAPLGPFGMIVGGALSEADAAITEGRDAGLRGKKLAAYSARQGAIEGTIAGAMQKVGLGGFEKIVGGKAAISNGIRQTLKQGKTLRGAAKGIGRDFLEEEVEEVTTAVLQDLNTKYSGVDSSEITLKSLASTAAETTSQVAWTMLGVGVPNVAAQVSEGRRAKAQQEVVASAESGKAPTRKQAKEWGLPVDKIRSAKDRQQAVQEMAGEIQAEREGLDKTRRTLSREVEQYWGTSGVSSVGRKLGFVPAFRDSETGEIIKSVDSKGEQTSLHSIENLPEKYVTERDPQYGDVVAASGKLESGFTKEGKFYTREQASLEAPGKAGTSEVVPEAAPVVKPADLTSRLSEPDGGFTYQPVSGAEASGGYGVSVFPGREKIIEASKITEKDVTDYAEANRDIFEASPKNFMGAWHDPDSGDVYLDVSQVVETKEEAVALGQKHKQKAYFDFQTFESVPIKAALGAAPAEAAPPTPPKAARPEMPAWGKTFVDWYATPEHEGRINSAGEAIPVYHGTKSNVTIENIRPGSGGAAGPGIYVTTTKRLASDWAGEREGSRVIQFYLTGKYLEIPYSESINAIKWAEEARREGYAGAKVLDEIVVFDRKNLTHTKPPKQTPPLRKTPVSHEELVRKALSEGKPVPPDVLAEYPDLQPPQTTRSEMPFIDSLKERAVEAEPKKKGFLKEETGAKPLTGGPLGQRVRADEIGGQAGGVDISVGRPEVDARLNAARGIQQPKLIDKIREGVATAWRYTTRSQANIPNTPEFAVANETIRLLKAVPQSSKDDAIRIVSAVINPLGPEQMKLFERYAQIQNQAAALTLGQPLRHGFANRGEVEAYKAKLEVIIDQTPVVKEAIEARKQAVREVVGAAVAHGLVPESALQNADTYFHQQVLMYHATRGKYAGGTMVQKTKKSFQKKRVAGETLESLDKEYDYNTDYLQSEVSWIADALSQVRKEQLLDNLMAKYDVSDKIRKIAKARNMSLNKTIRESENLSTWQPTPGNTFYRAFSIPEKIAAKLQSGVLESYDLTEGELTQVLAVGSHRKTAVIPKELALELESMREPEAPHWITQLNQAAMKQWKAWRLLGPQSIIPYELRNMTGDADPALAAHPRIVMEIKSATKELRNLYNVSKPLTQEQQAARDLGVTSSGFFTSEIGEISNLRVFAYLDKTSDRVLRKLARPDKAYMEAVRPINDFREDLLRYSAFKYYRKELARGNLEHFGASHRDIVKRLQKDMGNDVAAAHMARNLLGDYGNMTVAGEWVRRNLIPFWAFQEINIKRWPRLTINAFQAGEGQGRIGKMYAAAAVVRLAQGYSALWAWNNIVAPMIWGFDDDDDLPTYERANPHVLLGRTADGSVRIFRNVGALGDFLEWIGVNEAISLIDKYKSGQVKGSELITEMLKSPIEKLVSGLRPDIKSGFEVLTGQSLFPSPFLPRAVDRGESVAGVFGLADEYKWAKGMTLGTGDTAKRHFFLRWFVGTVDPRAAALNEMYDLRSRFLADKGSPEKGTYPISEYKIAREAAIKEDYNSFVKWRVQFQKRHPMDYGSRFSKFLGRMDPIASRLNDSDESEFVNKYLTSEQRDKLKVARDYSSELRVRMMVWWRAAHRSNNELVK